MKHIFGPVPSRRLGRSLGIDVIPAKTCTFDCIYCESGPTTRLTLERGLFAPADRIVRELEEYFRLHPGGADALTFSSAGEPTLYLALGELIRSIKKRFPALPLVVLTNGSLLWDEDVRKGLMAADRVVPSLDSATPETFKALNRPHPLLSLERIIEGLAAFRREYTGRFHLEILLASGLNDTAAELERLREVADILDPDLIELNTVVRPPVKPGLEGLSRERMIEAARFFPAEKVEVIGSFCAATVEAHGVALSGRIMETIERRPCTVRELAASLGSSEKKIEAAAAGLERLHKLERRCFNETEFLCPSGGSK